MLFWRKSCWGEEGRVIAVIGMVIVEYGIVDMSGILGVSSRGVGEPISELNDIKDIGLGCRYVWNGRIAWYRWNWRSSSSHAWNCHIRQDLGNKQGQQQIIMSMKHISV